MNLTTGLRKAIAFDTDANAEALVCGDARLDNRTFVDRVARLASALVEFGMGDGDRVAMLAANGQHYIEYYFGVLWGGGVIDLRYADFTSTEVDIHACSIMGGQTILLPPEVNVEIDGHGVMGGFDHEVAGQGTPGAPTVRIRGFSLWGGVGVRRKNRKTQR